MDDASYLKMRQSLAKAAKRYPNCKIANCDCNSKNNERIDACYCLCHINEIVKEIKEENLNENDIC